MQTEGRSTMQFFRLLLCLPVLLAQTECFAHGQNTPAQCQYEYTEQPPHQIHCNPYSNSQLKLECTIEAPLNQFPQVVWFRSRFHQDPDSGMDWWIMERLDGSLPGILVREQHRVSSESYTMRSQLQISNLDDSDIGDYWCRMVVSGTQWLIPSDTFFLQRSSAYTQYGACTTRFAQSKLERKCAAWEPTTATTGTPTMSSVRTVDTSTTNTPTTITSTDDSSTTVTVASRTTPATTNRIMSESTVSTQTNSYTTEEDYSTTVPAVISTSTSPISTPESATEEVIIVTEQEHPTTLAPRSSTVSSTRSFVETESSTDSDLLELSKSGPSRETPGNRKNQFLRKELYISVAVLLLFGVLILILIPITVCLCIRRRNRKGMRARHKNYMENQATDDTEEEPSTGLQAQASDYLVPLPVLNNQLQRHLGQFPRLPQRSQSLQHSYETTISSSHEYEDIPDLSEESSRNKQIHSYDNGGSIRMKRNAAYKVNKTWDSRRGAAIQCHDMVIPNPMNCFYYNNYRIHEQEPSPTVATRV